MGITTDQQCLTISGTEFDTHIAGLVEPRDEKRYDCEGNQIYYNWVRRA